MNGNYVPALRFHWLTRFYDPLVRRLFRELPRKLRLIEHGPPAAGERVLDLGAGTGTLAALLLQRQPACSLLVADISLEMLSVARRKLRPYGGRAQLVCAAADALPLAAGRIDRVFSSLTFHHLPPVVKVGALSELARALRPGGRFLLLDFARPDGPLAWAGATLARLFDGWDNTADNVSGRLLEMIAEAGFAPPHELFRERTPLRAARLSRHGPRGRRHAGGGPGRRPVSASGPARGSTAGFAASWRGLPPAPSVARGQGGNDGHRGPPRGAGAPRVLRWRPIGDPRRRPG